MSSHKKTEEESLTIDDAIQSVFEEMKSVNADSPEYSKMADQLEKLYRIKATQKSSKMRDKVDPNTIIAVAGNLAGIAAILSYEKMHVITTKAMGFIGRNQA